MKAVRLLIVVSLVLGPIPAFGAPDLESLNKPKKYPPCTEAQANNKKLALGRGQARIIAANPTEGDALTARLAVQISRVGQLMSEKKYGEACAKYEEIAGQYAIDLDRESKGLITYEELVKDGGRRGGICSQSDASKKVMGFGQQISARIAKGETSTAEFDKFHADTAKLSELLYTDPSKMCAELDGLKSKYNLR